MVQAAWRSLYAVDAFVTKQILHRADVGPAFKEVSGKRVSQHVRRHTLRNAGRLGREPNRVLKAAIQDMGSQQAGVWR